MSAPKWKSPSTQSTGQFGVMGGGGGGQFGVMSSGYQPINSTGSAVVHSSQPAQVYISYRDPLVTSTYDVDGLQKVFDMDTIDWDDKSIWKNVNWVALPEVDESIAGPEWKGLTAKERKNWWNNNRTKNEVKNLFPKGQHGSALNALGNDSPLAGYYNQIRSKGQFGGTDIDFGYYQNEPVWQVAFGNIFWDDIEGLDAPDWNKPGGVTVEHLKVGFKYIVETFRAVRDDAYRQPWDAPLPEPITPKQMSTDYVSPDLPGIVPQLPKPTMSKELKKVAAKSGSTMAKDFKALKAKTPKQKGFVDPNPD